MSRTTGLHDHSVESMAADPVTAPATFADPAAEYQQRLRRFRLQQTDIERRLAWLGNARFAVVAAVFVLFWLFLIWKFASLFWLSIPLGLFVALSVLFDQAAQRLRYVYRAISYYERGIARLEDRWAGTGTPGTNYLDENHLYAADLDLFGSGSLFERINDARTRIGRDTLAQWLRSPASPEEVVQRQEAIRELRVRLNWRERLAQLGPEVPEGIETATLAEWGYAVASRPSPRARQAAPYVVCLTWLVVGAWLANWLPVSLAVLALLLQGGFALWLRKRVRRATAGLGGRSRDLFQLTHLLLMIEQASFTSRRLVRIQEALRSEGVPPSRRLAQLVKLIAKLDSPRNLFFAPLAPLLLWTTQVALALERWRWETGPALPRWLTVIGEVEALNALAGYAYENPTDPFPELVSAGPRFQAVDLGHPLLPRSRCVTNDICLDDNCRLLVVSGSNMSGKSTFLRTVGVNIVLALAGAPVRASSLRLSPLAIGATLRIQDSLQAGRSRFYAEITRLRHIVELTKGPVPVVFLLDEILHGTNSHDRWIGARAVVRTLLQRPAIGLVTTHDLALTRLADQLAPRAANVHFADQLVDGVLHFDYRLHPGVVQHSNALALMRAVGLDVNDDSDSGRLA
jgi:hypothetical protein